MEKILHTNTIDRPSTNIIIDVIERTQGKRHLRIIQSTEKNQAVVRQSKLLLNQDLLEALLPILEEALFQLRTSQESQPVTVPSFKVKVGIAKEKEIISSYFKGVSIKDIAMRFGFKEGSIASVLSAHHIPILSEKEMKPPKAPFRSTPDPNDPWPEYWKNRKKKK